MSSFNPLATILSRKPMDGKNYKQWKTNLDIVLQFEKLDFVLTTPKPAQPAENAFKATKTHFSNWEKANVSVRCYILASLANHLQEQVSMIESGAEMVKTLDDMFATSSSSARQNALTAVTKTIMTGGSVWDHCLAMIANFKQADNNGIKFVEEVKVDLLLQSLPEYFNQFKISYNMNKLNMDLTQLMHELESADPSLVKQENAFFVAESSVKPKGKPKRGNKKRKRRDKVFQLPNLLQ
ncbi:uncharacterized protein LOC133313983 [Gastrolobium bilobum]|uniref:uncharacterized protein LOC133313983 n=1 Tax=Gastrolobium bilobum TaxID=150636 RepID=UPI002AB2F3D5|nr:uncharacterized protein LOC133313983 [Gastrolobium bilobum]